MKTLKELRFEHGIPQQILDVMAARDVEWSRVAMDIIDARVGEFAAQLAAARADGLREAGELLRATAWDCKVCNGVAKRIDGLIAIESAAPAGKAAHE